MLQNLSIMLQLCLHLSHCALHMLVQFYSLMVYKLVDVLLEYLMMW